jgi:hypothetical protein
MKRKNPIAQLFSDPTRNFLFFIFLSAVLSLTLDGLSKLIWDDFFLWLKISQGISDLWLFRTRIAIVVLLASIFFLFLYAINFYQRLSVAINKVLNRLPEVSNTNVVPLLETLPGLIVVMSRKDPKAPENSKPAAEVAIRHHLQDHKLQHCWVICTDQSYAYAEEIQEKLIQEKLLLPEQMHFQQDYKLQDDQGEELSLLIPHESVNDPNYIKKLVNAIYNDAANKGLGENEIIADYTGGTKSMTAGVVLACASPGRRLQYIIQSEPNQIMEVLLSYRLKPIKN